MKYIRLLFIILFVVSISSCGFEDNLPCKASECENIPPDVPNKDNEG